MNRLLLAILFSVFVIYPLHDYIHNIFFTLQAHAFQAGAGVADSPSSALKTENLLLRKELDSLHNWLLREQRTNSLITTARFANDKKSADAYWRKFFSSRRNI